MQIFAQKCGSTLHYHPFNFVGEKVNVKYFIFIFFHKWKSKWYALIHLEIGDSELLQNLSLSSVQRTFILEAHVRKSANIEFTIEMSDSILICDLFCKWNVYHCLLGNPQRSYYCRLGRQLKICVFFCKRHNYKVHTRLPPFI